MFAGLFFGFILRSPLLSPYSKLIIVKDSAEISYGVVSTEGKFIAPCKNYVVAIGDYDSSVFFVKRVAKGKKGNCESINLPIESVSDYKNFHPNSLAITKGQRSVLLKDQQIDCSNASAFITTVENRFMLTKEGVDFCFDSTENHSNFVIISFTWAELKPFLKVKIY